MADEKRRADKVGARAEGDIANAAQQINAIEVARDAAQDEVEELKAALASRHAVAQAQAVELARIRERLILTEQTAQDASAHHLAEFGLRGTC